ncbi:MAG: CCA tRNA nucleotidyltransferase [Turicibacter sp.]|nr:CCA tRNA nucleotidyltransferase [Turicibacter sp.]
MDLLIAGDKVLKILNEAGYEAYFVGGMVRDQLINRRIYDIDITTSAKPEVVMSLFEKTIPTGLAHGTITVMIDKVPIEVTTFRVESSYTDYRHPTNVLFTTSLEEDLKRRDFTMNAIAKDKEGRLYDPLNGLEDLSHKMIKCVGIAGERFKEDPLRMLRGIRFVSKLGFTLDSETLLGMKKASSLIVNISKERVKRELEGIILGSSRQKAMDDLYQIQLLEPFSDLALLKRYCEYNFEVLTHPILLFVLASLQVNDLPLYLANWPFSREEKKCIEVLRASVHSPTPLPYFTYRYGEVWAERYHQLMCFLNQESVPYQSIELAIQSRKQLAIDAQMILQVINRQKGPWIHALLEEIEYKVVMGQLVNEHEVLIEYIKQYG